MIKKIVLLFVLLVYSAAAYAQPYSIQQYLSIRSAGSPSMSPDGREVAYLSNATGTTQAWATLISDLKPRQLTNYEDNVSFVKWLSDGSGIIFGKAKGGDENTQFYWMKPDGSGVRALTHEPSVRHNFGFLTDDDHFIAYSSNKRNRNFFDIYLMDLATGNEALIYQQDGNNSALAMDIGGKLIVSRDGQELSLDNDLFLVTPRSKSELLLTPHTGSAQFGNAHFTADGIVFAHNDNREFIGLAQMRQKNAAGDGWSQANLETSMIDDAKWDVSDVEMGQYGNLIAYTINRDGYSEIYLRKYETGGKPLITTIGKSSEIVKLPAQGIVSGLAFNKNESHLAFSFSSSTRSGDIFVYDIKAKKLIQVTQSDRAGIDAKSFVTPTLIHFKTFDGRLIPAWFYKPLSEEEIRAKQFGDSTADIPIVSKGNNNTKPVSGPIGRSENYDRPRAQYDQRMKPVIVSVHGGPEGQERSGFNPLYQYFLSRGYAILATNVRGSTGYGKTFTHLDDVLKREDSVKDLAASVEWLKTKGGADPKRIAVMGGSYGGYMTLAAITLYPELWAAAVDTVGISNWESFLKNTSGYRRRQREVEYGRLDRDIDFLRSISPMAKIDRIKCPLFVIAGKNDPRVPWTEGDQIVNALKKRGATVQWKLYDDEGHGVSKLKNRLELYPLVADFLDKNMKK